jgi:hypothetical protein
MVLRQTLYYYQPIDKSKGSLRDKLGENPPLVVEVEGVVVPARMTATQARVEPIRWFVIWPARYVALSKLVQV